MLSEEAPGRKCLLTTATAIGPVVRMCDDPDCHGWDACPGANMLMGLADTFRPRSATTGPWPCSQNLALSVSKDSAGVARVVPDGAEFLLHKSAYAAAGTIGEYRWTAVYSGAGGTIDEVLAGAPGYEASTDLVHDRLRRMREAGVFDAALRERTPGG